MMKLKLIAIAATGLMISLSAGAQPNVAEGIAAFNSKNYDQAAEIFKANQDNPTAKYYLYRMFSDGLGVAKDSDQATQYLEQAAAGGDIDAMDAQGYRLINEWTKPKPTPSQVREGMAMLIKAKDRGSRDAMITLGNYYIKRPDRAEAMKGLDYLEKSNATWELAVAYANGGPAFPRNQVKALEYWRALEADPKSSEFARRFAAYYVDEYYYYGAGTPANPALAAQRLAKQSDPNARSLYAWMLFRGDGVKKDQRQAVQIWEDLLKNVDSFKTGFTGVLYLYLGLGVAYQNGLGVSPDPIKAEKMLAFPALSLEPAAAWCLILGQEGLIRQKVLSVTCDGKNFMMHEVLNDGEALGPSRYQRLNARAILAANAEQIPPRWWNYSTYIDQMSGMITKEATLSSTNTHQLVFPYNGGTRGTLILRKHPRYGNDIIFSVNKGQLLCGDGCFISIKFDDKKPYSVGASEPDDHSSTVLFLSKYDYNKLLKDFRNSKKVLVEVKFFQQGTRVFEFDTTGLKWN